MHRYDPNDKEACPIWDTVQEAQAFKTMTDGMKFFLGAVGIVTLLLGGIGVMNVMLVAVRERTREIGVRKAIGAPAGTILRQFFIEALIIALLSGGIGLGVAFGFCALVNMLPMPDFFAGLVPSWSSGLIARGCWARLRWARHCILRGGRRRLIRLRRCGMRREDRED